MRQIHLVMEKAQNFYRSYRILHDAEHHKMSSAASASRYVHKS